MSVETFSCVRCIAEFIHKFYYDSSKPPPSSFLHWIELCLEMRTVAVVRVTREKEADVVRVTREKEADVVRVTREKEANVVRLTRDKEANVVRVTREKEAAEGRFQKTEDINCTCAPFQGVGFCEVTPTTLYLSQFCVTKEYRSRGLCKQIALYFITKYSSERVMFWSINPAREPKSASVVTRRFVVKLREGAADAPKTAGIFSRNRTEEERGTVGCDEERLGKSARLETNCVQKRRRMLGRGYEKGERSGLMTSSISGHDVTMATMSNKEHVTICEASTADIAELHEFILEFQKQWRYFKPMSYKELNILLSSKYRDIVRVMTVKKCAERQDGDGNKLKEDLVGVIIIKILAVRRIRGERKTAVLSHISWDTTHPSFPSLLLNASIQLSRDLGCHVLLCNECCGLGGLLEGDTRLRDMREVGVENKVSVWEGGQLVMGVEVGEFGMTLFE